MTAARWMAVVVIAGYLAVAAMPGMVAPRDPTTPDFVAYAAPSAQRWLGTDDIGRDIASRLVWGARASVLTAGGVAGLALALAVLLGVVPALCGGWLDAAAARLSGGVIALPRLPLLILVGALAGGDRPLLVVTLGLLSWPPAARVLRGAVLVLRARGHVVAARGFGAGWAHLLRRHVLPVVAPLLAAEAVTIASGALLLDASLAFLGLGGRTDITWGGEIHRVLAEPGALFGPAWLWWALPNAVAITGLMAALVIAAGSEQSAAADTVRVWS